MRKLFPADLTDLRARWLRNGLPQIAQIFAEISGEICRNWHNTPFPQFVTKSLAQTAPMAKFQRLAAAKVCVNLRDLRETLRSQRA